ncbi:MAG TPA: glycosyltransferase [Acidimicrobiales bacterium]|nr:glycosyltransferase [Acidimicrobiales bacterium]
MKVVHVLEALEGGTARHVSDVVRHIEGVTHHVVVPHHRVGGITDWRAVPDMRAAGAEIHRVEMRRLPVSPRNASALAELRSLLKRVRPDVVHGHSSIGGALGRTAAADLNVLRVYTPNGLHPAAAAGLIERALRPLTDHFVAVSQSEAIVALARGFTDAPRLAVIPNGIELDGTGPEAAGAPADGSGGSGRSPVDLRRLLGVPPNVRLVGFIGRFASQKAPEVVVEVAAALHARHPDVHVAMIGSGRHERHVRRLVSELGLDDTIHLVPYLARAARVMSELDVFLLPSRYEGCPYTVLEAMRVGTPVVVSDAVGNRDLVTDGVTGRVARVGDGAATAEALGDVLSDPAAARTMAEAARRQLAPHHDVRVMAGAVRAIYEGAVSAASPVA